MPDLPLVAEREVADALGPTERLIAAPDFDPEDGYAGTPGVAKAAAEALLTRGIRRVVVLAHPGHRRRAAWCCRTVGLDPVLVPRLNVPFDPESAQWWTRGAVRWWLREVPARAVNWYLSQRA
jgi:hypothetical protein